MRDEYDVAGGVSEFAWMELWTSARLRGFASG